MTKQTLRDMEKMLNLQEEIDNEYHSLSKKLILGEELSDTEYTQYKLLEHLRNYYI